jgi:hypothetical protein
VFPRESSLVKKKKKVGNFLPNHTATHPPPQKKRKRKKKKEERKNEHWKLSAKPHSNIQEDRNLKKNVSHKEAKRKLSSRRKTVPKNYILVKFTTPKPCL